MHRSIRFFTLLLVVASLATPAFAGGVMAKVVEVVNGNTLKCNVSGKEMNVRLYGIATPDPNDALRPLLKRLGGEAREFLSEFTKSGWVYLEFPSGTAKPDHDGYVDAYVYGGKASEFLNEKIVFEGFGIVNRKQQSAFHDKLIVAEGRARGSSKGLWGQFQNGGGKNVAAGTSHQATYMGESGRNSGWSAIGEAISMWMAQYGDEYY